ncbi:MAG: hypothetical protein BWY95_02732 [Bacteroidetes bacterium ADurb.BinA104]|nr:MAG: hypothetical protein BWY95_02732 [Bacteroidetes bacterium ADurb.BinA104]
MIGRCQHDLIVFGQNNGLQDIHHLCNVSHADTITVFVKNIHVGRTQQSIAQGVLLIKEAGIGAGFYIVPGSPFVYTKGNSFAGIVPVHYGHVSADQLIHKQRLLHGGEVFLFGKIGGRSLTSGTPAFGDSVMM